ncbi:MAG: FemAB-related protein (PEP-CTERM system-associated) [Psychroserpens sp.]|jgi:FemAB-related protein (PEP-CTERM system-associated)
MNIRIVNKKDQAVWDEYVNGHINATPYQRFAWLLSVEQAYKHKNVSLIALDNDKVVGVLPCIKMTFPFSKARYCALPFCDLGFALADNETIIQNLKSESVALLQTDGGKSFEYRDSLKPSPVHELEGQKVRMLLSLPTNAETLMAGFKSKLRSQIRKSEKNGLTYSINNSQKQIDDFYHILSINMRKLGSPVHSKKWFQCLFSNYAKHIFLSVVYSDNIPVGGGIVLRNADKVSIPWASTVADYNRLAPNMMLYWSLLAHMCDIGCTEFDFGRSTYNEGTYKFKRQWGAEPVPLAWSNLAKIEIAVADESTHHVNKIRTLVERTWAKLPLGVTTLLGPKIRKHISL